MPAHADISHHAVGQLVRSIGQANFIDTLLKTAKNLGGADFVSMFLYPDPASTVFMGTASSIGRRFAMLAADNYCASGYQHDPNRALMFEGQRNTPTPWVHTYMRRDDVPTMQYRSLCYDRAQISDRLSLISRNRYGTAFSVSFYSGRPHGDFSEKSKQSLLSYFPILHSITARHADLADPAVDVESVLRRFRFNYPELSPREAQVAAGVVAGMSASNMAEWLGIAQTSIVTHRKKAYDRLGAEGQNDLMRLYYARL